MQRNTEKKHSKFTGFERQCSLHGSKKLCQQCSPAAVPERVCLGDSQLVTRFLPG